MEKDSSSKEIVEKKTGGYPPLWKRALPFIGFAALGATAGIGYAFLNSLAAQEGWIVDLPLHFKPEAFDQDKRLHDLFKELSAFRIYNEQCYDNAARYADNLLFLEKSLKDGAEKVANVKNSNNIYIVQPEPGDILDAKSNQELVSTELLGLHACAQLHNTRHSTKIKAYALAIAQRLIQHITYIGHLCRSFPL